MYISRSVVGIKSRLEYDFKELYWPWRQWQLCGR